MVYFMAIFLSGPIFHVYFKANLSDVVPGHGLGSFYGHEHMVTAIWLPS